MFSWIKSRTSRPRLRWLVVAAAIGGVFATVGRSDVQRNQATLPLFILERDQNKNRLIYEVRLQAGELDQQKPIHPYWKMLADDGRLEDLTALEAKYAYGVAYKEVGARHVVFICKALPNHPIRALVSPDASDAKAMIQLLNRDYVLERVFLHTAGFGPIRSVKTIDMFCREAATDRPIKIVLVPGARGRWTERAD